MRGRRHPGPAPDGQQDCHDQRKFTLRGTALGFKLTPGQYNPETYSTDFDTADKLYFEELSYERVMDIYELENASGVVVSVGGQLPQNIALRLQEKGGAHVLGTDPADIDKAEDRQKFSEILDSIGVDQPAWKELTSVAEAEKLDPPTKSRIS